VISCEDALRDLWGYLSDEVTPATRGRIAEHLEACRRCCGELEFLAELQRFIATAGARLPVDVETRMEAFLATLEGSDGGPDVQG
jgi:anti-sigma factor RsiW